MNKKLIIKTLEENNMTLRVVNLVPASMLGYRTADEVKKLIESNSKLINKLK